MCVTISSLWQEKLVSYLDIKPDLTPSFPLPLA
jgi:hypothetical protein